MPTHLLSAFVVVTPVLMVALVGVFRLRFGGPPWPAVIFALYAVGALIAVALLVRRRQLRTLGTWFGGTIAGTGLLCLLFLFDGRTSLRDAVEILTVAAILIAGGLTILALLRRPRKGETMTTGATDRAVGGEAAPTKTAAGSLGDEWIVIEDHGDEVAFLVRQRRVARLRRSLVWFGGAVAGVGGATLLALYLFTLNMRYGEDWTVAAGLFAAVVALAFALVAVAAIPTLFSGLGGLRHSGTVSFAVGSEGIVADGGRTLVPFKALQGPFYRTSDPLFQEATAVHGGTPVVYGGYGVGAAAAVGMNAAMATAQGLRSLGPTLRNSTREGLNFVRRTSSGEVFVRNMARPVVLARLLSDEEAEFLCEKVAEAVLRLAGAPLQSDPDAGRR